MDNITEFMTDEELLYLDFLDDKSRKEDIIYEIKNLYEKVTERINFDPDKYDHLIPLDFTDNCTSDTDDSDSYIDTDSDNYATDSDFDYRSENNRYNEVNTEDIELFINYGCATEEL